MKSSDNGRKKALQETETATSQFEQGGHRSSTNKKTRRQLFEGAQQRYFDMNRAFLDMVNCQENPMSRRDLEQLIRKRPEVYRRFSGWLDKLTAARVGR